MSIDEDLTTRTRRPHRNGHSVLSSRGHVERALERISDDGGREAVRAVIEVNPLAETEAAYLDIERATGWRRGPLHGKAVLVKDNIDTAGPMHTTAGSLALQGSSPLEDAPVVRNVRAAGLVVLGKANLSEWANYRSSSSISGWSAVGGLTRNPHNRQRLAGGSSSGSAAAVAAGMAPMAIGTETDGSIICPAAFCGIVGLKPTVGLVPTQGVIPISHSQDSVGPMARTVRDAALLLAAMVGEPDAARLDPARSVMTDFPMRGIRLGLPRTALWSSDPGVSAAVETAVMIMARLGATIVDQVEIPGIADFDPADEQCVLDHELKVGLAGYLATRSPGGPRTLAEVIDFNRAHADTELVRFDQDIFERAEATDGLESRTYREARQRCLGAAQTNGLDAVIKSYKLDALVMPSADTAFPAPVQGNGATSEQQAYIGDRLLGPTALPAMAGYPMLTVPCGVVDGLPVGVAFVGLAKHERVLLRLGHIYEMNAFGPAGSAAAFPPPAS